MTPLKGSREGSKLKRCETLGEAHLFTVVRNAYAAAGLCSTCAPQAAYMHAHGAAAVRARCPGCPGAEVFSQLRQRLRTARSLLWLSAPDPEVDSDAGGSP